MGVLLREHANDSPGMTHFLYSIKKYQLRYVIKFTTLQ